MSVGAAIRFVLVCAAIGTTFGDHARAADRFITVSSTTSVRNSGLYDWLLPRFKNKMGIDVRVIAVGTGQAIRLARRGDADVLLVHDKPSEMEFVANGFGTGRREIMYNYFVIVGPDDDPARIRGSASGLRALLAIAGAKAPFVSRGDDSGTHKLERRLWRVAGFDPSGAGSWYREVGAGMGATLNMAVAMQAYVLTDNATWIASRNRKGLTVLLNKAESLKNQYSVMLVNPKEHPHVKEKDGQAFIRWLVSAEGQAAIAAYKVNGTQLFFPNAAKTR